MARIGNIALDTSVTKTDKLLGSNSNGATQNFAISDINTFLKNTSSSKLVYTFETNSNAISAGKFIGTFSTAQKTFTALTSIKVSKFPSGSDSAVVEYLQSLVNNDIIFNDVDNINNFGVYTVSSVTQDSNATDYYDIALVAKTGNNGILVDEQFYSIILYAGAGGDKTFSHTQNASASSWTINHNLGKKPSVTITTLATGAQVIGEVTYTNNNTLVVSFAAAVSGIAHLN
jgi:hypothetical protein